MKSRDFCYWLQGFFEINDAAVDSINELTHEQVEMIKNHLALVFKHEIDPAMGNADHQEELNEIHSGKKPKPPKELIMRC